MKKEKGTHPISDMRLARPIIYIDKSTNKAITLQRSEVFTINDCEIIFPAPNNVSLFASIAKKERQQAKNIHSSLIAKNIKTKKAFDVKDKDITRLFNYFEHIQSSIIAIYTAIEAFANIAIPADFTHTFKNNKGITETWNKAAIERWYKTSDKISELLPKILGSESPKTMANWSKFKDLENIRNEIIHQKTKQSSGEKNIDSSFLGTLLSNEIFNTIDSGFELISFFCQKDTYHSFFPMGFSDAHLKPIEVDSFTDSFKLHRKAEE
ncbi:hypothetical protein KRX52_06995 [Pseudomonas sp. MAP12]|uniref:RiboL-PSP-HEPN domain-containing protein n=1 Tax=Geopseudomonas aromaticivorans TaxID=2849492 RepID=A0ABS6MW13_9GAMM|nr:hypothetical protein [Pseudomonas aromaticivorans]MBV2132551.1 hypothetical protein [Pseudomonas aromaticivorans]